MQPSLHSRAPEACLRRIDGRIDGRIDRCIGAGIDRRIDRCIVGSE
jgi:hypothetical protein